MAVSLDLADPVLVIVNALIDNWSLTPVVVLTGYTRGGYSPRPPIIPIEGEEGKPVKRTIDVKQIEEKAIILVSEVSDNETETDIAEIYADVKIRVSIDIRQGERRSRLISLYNEVKRIIYKIKKNPGGNYTYLKRLPKQDFTNKQIQLFRYVVDVELTKVSDYLGHA